jgi:hypothetical protein
MPIHQQRRLDAAGLAELCLSQLAEAPEQLAEFMRAKGYDPAALRQAVGTQQLVAGLIDYFASNEPLLLALCANHNLKPEEFMHVWHRLNPSD